MLRILCTLSAVFLSAAAHAQAYPSKPLRIIVPFAQGGAADVPTVAEQNLPGFEAVSWYSIMVPAGTPKEIIERINGEIARMLTQPETREKLAGIGATAIGGTQDQLADVIREESARYADLFKRAGIPAE